MDWPSDLGLAFSHHFYLLKKKSVTDFGDIIKLNITGIVSNVQNPNMEFRGCKCEIS